VYGRHGHHDGHDLDLESGPGAEDLASLTIDMSGGPFTPGKTDEGDGSSEIEFLTGDQDTDADQMTLGSVTIVGTPGADTILIGVIADGGYSPIDLNGMRRRRWDVLFGVDGADLDTPPAVDGGAATTTSAPEARAQRGCRSNSGGDGNDTLGGGTFDDQIDGGAGSDTIVAAYEASIDLAAGIATSIMGDTDTLSGLENIVGSGNGSDLLVGDQGPNRIEGGTVESCPECDILGDVISGGGGDDELIGSEWLETGLRRDVRCHRRRSCRDCDRRGQRHDRGPSH
jgi:Ca2+-binding RTX toxin-like protein